MHVQDPLGQFVKEQVAPASHSVVHPPSGQSMVQLEFAAHAAAQSPSGHSMAHVAPAGHDVLQCPSEQSTVHCPAPQYVRQ